MVFDLEAQHRGRSQPNKYVRGDMATSPGARARQGQREDFRAGEQGAGEEAQEPS